MVLISIIFSISRVVLQNNNFELNDSERNFYTNEFYSKTRLPDDVGTSDPRIAKAGFLKNIVVVDKDRCFLQISRKILFFLLIHCGI